LKKLNKNNLKIQFEEGSGNVFSDFGFEDADDLFVRAQLGYCVYKILEEKKLKQQEVAELHGMAQPDISYLMNGHFSRFTADKLLNFLKRLNRKVTIQISPRLKGEPYQEIGFTL
jgi:predicted XRE-type DNA-binding protein